MAKLYSVPRHRRLPSFTGRVMVDTVRGVLRVRKWPRKRGKPTNPTTLWWNDWFRQANFLAKYADAMSMRRAIEMTEGTPLYPRDVLLSAMRGRLYSWVDDTGWKWYPVAAQRDISESLDVLAQAIGSVLVRATDRWRAPPAGVVGDVLTYQGAVAPPVWTGAPGGVVQSNVAPAPISPDSSVSEYTFDVSGFLSVQIIVRAVSLSASQELRMQFSTDGGATWRNGGTDYFNFLVTAAAENFSYNDFLSFSDGISSTSHNGIVDLTFLRASRASLAGQFTATGASCAVRRGGTIFDGPITDLRLYTSGGATFNGGIITAVGETSV
jgi:hypothetical protein